MNSNQILSFWQSINLLIIKPHVINKRLWGCIVLKKYYCKFQQNIDWKDSFNDLCLENLGDICTFMEQLVRETWLDCIEENHTALDQSNRDEIVIIELLPKTFTESHCYQLVCLKKDNCSAIFYDITPKDFNQKLCPMFKYTFQLLPNGNVVISENYDTNSKSYIWLLKEVLPQIVKWQKQNLNNIPTRTTLVKDSLNLVSLNEYYNKYNQLKMKYGKEMVKIWPECTDPTKFVYEDVAIATYLLLLWDDKKYNKTNETVNFVDIGCGNGLLVYILTKEGHNGLGVDVRKRKIWDMYGDEINLNESTFTPENIKMFADFNWIIGNHSDELTPWIPVIAANSNYNCNFFLLPCCAFNFDGSKYQRQNSSYSQYNEYLDYIHKLCENCGFATELDRLKIPSTKRICLVGRKRKYEENEYDTYVKKISLLIGTSGKNAQTGNNAYMKDEFKARSATERVKNCTQIGKPIIEFVVATVAKFLLDGCNFDNEWIPGKETCIEDLIKAIPQTTLKLLKSECGGLQTLLKNNYIFNVHKGKVQLKHPLSIDATKELMKKRKNKANLFKLQVKPCWFYNNHPQGCPLADTVCSFLHVKS